MGDAFALHRRFFDIDNDKLVEAQKTTSHATSLEGWFLMYVLSSALPPQPDS
jgi:hypothetical protein